MFIPFSQAPLVANKTESSSEFTYVSSSPPRQGTCQFEVNDCDRETDMDKKTELVESR
jgi:hypothetical protein